MTKENNPFLKSMDMGRNLQEGDSCVFPILPLPQPLTSLPNDRFSSKSLFCEDLMSFPFAGKILMHWRLSVLLKKF